MNTDTHAEIRYLNRSITALGIFMIFICSLMLLMANRIVALEKKTAGIYTGQSGAVSITELRAGVIDSDGLNIWNSEQEYSNVPGIALQSNNGVPSITLYDNHSSDLNMLLLTVDPERKEPYIKAIQEPYEPREDFNAEFKWPKDMQTTRTMYESLP